MSMSGVYVCVCVWVDGAIKGRQRKKNRNFSSLSLLFRLIIIIKNFLTIEVTNTKNKKK